MYNFKINIAVFALCFVCFLSPDITQKHSLLRYCTPYQTYGPLRLQNFRSRLPNFYALSVRQDIKLVYNQSRQQEGVKYMTVLQSLYSLKKSGHPNYLVSLYGFQVLSFEPFGRMSVSTLRWSLLVSLHTQLLWPSCLSNILTSFTTLQKLLFE